MGLDGDGHGGTRRDGAVADLDVEGVGAVFVQAGSVGDGAGFGVDAGGAVGGFGRKAEGQDVAVDVDSAGLAGAAVVFDDADGRGGDGGRVVLGDDGNGDVGAALDA